MQANVATLLVPQTSCMGTVVDFIISSCVEKRIVEAVPTISNSRAIVKILEAINVYYKNS